MSSADPGGPSFLVGDDAGLRAILDGIHTIAVVGLSANPARESHEVASYLQRVGYRILPVNPKETEVLDERAVASLRVLREPVNAVLVFRRVNAVPEMVDDCIAVGARVLWLQLGIVDPASAQRAFAAGMKVVMDRCMLAEHTRLSQEGA